jgi:glycosyltransferase involved in cell wall biosynthesis
MIYMITSGYGGCSYVRLQIPAYNCGFGIDKRSLRAKRESPEEVRNAVMQADAVVFHRPEVEDYHILADMLKRDGKKVIMDNDDTFKLDDSMTLANFLNDGTEIGLKKRNDCTDRFIKKADLVTTSTEFLADEYRMLSDNVVVLPNCVDPDDWDEPLRNETNQVRIGMIGSVSYEYDYLHLKPLLRKLSERKDVRLVLYGLGSKKHQRENPRITEAFKEEYGFWNSLDIDHIEWSPMEDYFKNLNEARLDIMLIPRKDNYFNRCKSNIKFLEASMLEIPVIAQSFENGPYEELTPDIGVLVRDNTKWEEEIERLIKDKDLRRSMGKKAKEYVLKNYNIADKCHLWAEAYSNLFL